jgi:serine/threonine protein kinase
MKSECPRFHSHGRGIIHRDIKPENIFLAEDGRVKVLDFGLAHLAAQPSGVVNTEAPTRMQQTDPGMILGTMGYMSPEQVRGQAVGAPSDIFALGCLLYEMLTGKRAFVRETAAEAIRQTADASTVPTMIALVRDGNVEARRAAVGALAHAGGPQAALGLLAALQDPDVEARRMAATALCRGTGVMIERALGGLLTLEGDGRPRRQAIGRSGSPITPRCSTGGP